MKKQQVKVIFLIAFTDRDLHRLIDTIDSISYYMKDTYRIICINDCKDVNNINFIHNTAFANVVDFSPRYDSNWPKNTYGSLFCKKYQGLEFVVANFAFDYVIFMDTDALLTGNELIEKIDKYFTEASKNIGIIGSYKIRTDGKKRTRWRWALFLIYLAYLKKKALRKTILWKEWLPKAKKNGYKLGDHMLGGAFISPYCFIKDMLNQYPYEILVRDKLFLVDLGDDVIFSMLAFTNNYKIGDFGKPGDPLAIAQRFLPISKEDVIKKKKQLIHSIKSGLNGESENELRTYFKGFRVQ